MKNVMPVLALFCLIAPVGTAADKVPMEGLKFKLDSDWNITDTGENSRGVIHVDYLRKGDDINHWKERFVYLSGPRRRGLKPPEEEYNAVKADEEKKCPGVEVWNIIEKDENSILFEWQSKPCKGTRELHAIWRIIQGEQSWFDLFYTASAYEISPDVRTKWIATLKDATIDPDMNPIDRIGVSKDVDEVVPFTMDKLMAAVKPAMESMDCKVTDTAADRIECKRTRGYSYSEHMGYGGESITATFEAQRNQTRVQIKTGKGFYGRLGKVNWSTPVYRKMMENLRAAQP
jgi:hypothetical protein